MAEKLSFEDLETPFLKTRTGDEQFRSVGIIGLGVMGQGIAETVASAGLEVLGIEKTEASLKAGIEGLE